MKRRKIRMKSDGAEVQGYEHNVKPLVDSGAAEWADLPPKKKRRARKTPKPTEVKDGDTSAD